MTDKERPAPVLVFAYGNPSRGDDALGPELIDRLSCATQQAQASNKLELLTDFQLQVEHAVDLKDRQLVIFADASLSAIPPFEYLPLSAQPDSTYTTHAISPASVLDVYNQLYDAPLPECYLLSMRGYKFELGQPLSTQAEINLNTSLEHLQNLLSSYT